MEDDLRLARVESYPGVSFLDVTLLPMWTLIFEIFLFSYYPVLRPAKTCQVEDQLRPISIEDWSRGQDSKVDGLSRLCYIIFFFSLPA